jgi:hypothetical protein
MSLGLKFVLGCSHSLNESRLVDLRLEEEGRKRRRRRRRATRRRMMRRRAGGGIAMSKSSLQS